MKPNMTLEVEGDSGEIVRLQITEREGAKRKRKVKTWTSDEDDLLIRLYEKHPKKWSCISSLMPERNENQCLHRYRRLSQLGRQRKIWSEEEDETVKKLIKKVGKNWKFLSQMLGTKTGKQIRERYINKLDPRIKKEEWSEQEDLRLIHLYSEHGSKWSEIAKKLAGRPENRIKNRFYSYIKRNYQIKEVVVKTLEAVKPLTQQTTNKDQVLQPISNNLKEPPKEPLAKASTSTQSIRIGSEQHIFQRVSFVEPAERPIYNHQVNPLSKMNLEGTELLIRQCKQPNMSSRGIGMSITSFTNFPEEDLIHYFDCGRRNDSLRFLDTF